MKNFEDFKKFMSEEGSTTHNEIVLKVNELVKKANIENPIEEQVFYYRTFSEISTLMILEKYHAWINQ